MNRPVLLLAMLGMVLLVALPAFAQTNVPILSPGTNLAGDTEDVCSAINQELLDLDLIGLSPESSDVIDSCNDVLNTRVNDQDTNRVEPTLELDQDAESGDFETASDLSVTGDNNQLCAPTQQSGNTGNSLNEQGALPTQGGFDDFEAGDSTLEEAAELSADCAPTLGQSAAAS